MPARYWTPERVARLRALYMQEKTIAEIAAEFGKTKSSVTVALSHNGISSPEDRAWRASRRLKGKKLSAKLVRKRGVEQRRRWKDPEFRAKQAGNMARFSDPEFIAMRADKQRGYTLTPEERKQYDFLKTSKKLPAAEVRRILGK